MAENREEFQHSNLMEKNFAKLFEGTSNRIANKHLSAASLNKFALGARASRIGPKSQRAKSSTASTWKTNRNVK